MAVITNGTRKLTHKDYTVAWIVVLEEELTAAITLLDEEDNALPPSEKDEKDDNNYILGRSGEHNVVITWPPRDGTNSAAHTVTNMLRTFPNVRFGLLVGIGGGAPKAPSKDHPSKDIRLGDVVVSTPKDGHGGVLQYDKGTSDGEDNFRVRSHLNEPPNILLGAVKLLGSFHKLKRGQMKKYIDEAGPTCGIFPGRNRDQLFKSEYRHVPGDDCTACDSKMALSRLERPTDDPVVHNGLIASGNSLMRSPWRRDKLRDDWNVACFEMEAAGLMNDFPCIVIRGISDYCDSHKNDIWHPYAAVTAAAYAKDLLRIIKGRDVAAVPTAKDQLNTPKQDKGSAQELSPLINRLDVLEQRLQALDSRLSGIITRPDSSVHELQRRFDGLDKRLGEIASQVYSTQPDFRKLSDQLSELKRRVESHPTLGQNSGRLGMDPNRIGVSEYGLAGRVEAGRAQITRRSEGGPSRIRFQQRFDRIPHVQITPELPLKSHGFVNFWLYLLTNGRPSVDCEGFDVGTMIGVGKTVTFRWLAVEIV